MGESLSFFGFRRRMPGGVVAGLVMIACATASPPASAQSETSLQEARELFGDALRDEQTKHFASALDKFRRVRDVKDTPQVRYRIASCLEGLGRLREARDAFAAIHAQSQTPEEQEVERAASEEARVLGARVPDLTVKLTGELASRASLEIDGHAQKQGRPVAVDPGEHTVVVTGAGVSHNELRVSVAEGTHPAIALNVGADHAVTSGDASHDGATRSGGHTAAYVGFGVGGALLVSSIVMLVVRHEAIQTVNDDCPNGVCPTAKRSEVDSARDQANTELPLAIGLAAGAAVVGGVAGYLYFRPSASTRVAIEPSPMGAMFRIVRTF